METKLSIDEVYELILDTARKFCSTHLLNDDEYELGFLLKLLREKNK